MAEKKAVIISISGVSSSGKTTLARLLRDIFPNTVVLHEDDFYKEESRIPKRAGFVDWECAEGIEFTELEKALACVRSSGGLPPDLVSMEDKNSVGKIPVSDAKMQAVKERVAPWLLPTGPGRRLLVAPGSKKPPPLAVCILDGFLLYTPTLLRTLSPLIDVKMFVCASRERAMKRRAGRDGYVTLEGFWSDPPGYVDTVVWPSYSEAHAWLFEGGDVETGALDKEVLEREGIECLMRGGETGNGVDVDLEKVLDWAVELIMRAVEKEEAL